MAKTNGNCENCHIKQRPIQKAMWRVKKTREELCDMCRVELEFGRDECEHVGAPVAPVAADRREVSRTKTSLNEVADVAHSAARKIEHVCDRGCGKPSHRGRCAGANANKVMRGIINRPGQSISNIRVPEPEPEMADGDSISVTVMTRTDYDEKFGMQKRWVSDEMVRIMKQVEAAPMKALLVVVPKLKKGEPLAQAIKNLRDRLYRGFVKNAPKTLPYSIKTSQVMPAGHVLIEKIQGGTK